MIEEDAEESDTLFQRSEEYQALNQPQPKATKVIVNSTSKHGAKTNLVESVYFDTPDIALIDKMLSQDPVVSKNASLWGESKATNYKLKNLEGQRNQLLDNSLQKLVLEE